MTGKEVRNIFKRTKDKNNIYFDCFDTLIQRKYSINFCFYRLGEYLIQECHLPLELEEIYYALINIFTRCDVPFEELERDVYLHYELDQNISFERFSKEFKDVLLNAELENVLPTENAKEIITNLKKAQKHLFVLSDFYLGKTEIEQIIVKVFDSNPFEDIYVSCDYGADKSKGGLYDKVVFRESSIMIGDNLRVDGYIPERKGIPSVHVDSSKNYVRYREFDEHYFKNARKSLLGYRNRPQKTYEANQIFTIYHFCKKLYAALNENDAVYFLARDGEFLKKCFDLYLAKKNRKNLRTEYLPISRLAMFLPAIDIPHSTAKKFKSDFKENTQWKIPSLSFLLRCLGFENEEINQVSVETQIIKDKDYGDFLDSEEFTKLWSNMTFKSILQRKQREAKEKFLSEVSVDSKTERLVTVDMGWRGTTQNNMKKALPDNISLYGCYIGTTTCVGEVKNSYKTGILFDYLNKKDYHDFSFAWIEPLLRTDKGQLVCYKKNGDFYLQDSSVNVYKSFAKERQQIMLEIFAKILDFDSVYPVSNNDFEYVRKSILKKEGYFCMVRSQYYLEYQNNNDDARKPSMDIYKSVLKRRLNIKMPRLALVLKKIIKK